MQRLLAITLLSIVSGLAFGCAKDTECPPGYFGQAYCSPLLPDAAPSGDGDGDGDVNEEDSSVEGDASAGPSCADEPAFEGGFNAPCTVDADCTCTADFCAVNPVEMTGVCTRQNCQDDPSICPADWTCFDLVFVPGLNFCQAPGGP